MNSLPQTKPHRTTQPRHTKRRRAQYLGRYLNGTLVYKIKSRSVDDGTYYLVTVNENTGKTACNCPATRPCWHIDRVLMNMRRGSYDRSVQPHVEPPAPCAYRVPTIEHPDASPQYTDIEHKCRCCGTTTADSYVEETDGLGEPTGHTLCDRCSVDALPDDDSGDWEALTC